MNVGWSKAKELVDLTEDTNVLERAIQVAETSTFQELQAHIATVEQSIERIGEDTRETLKAEKFTFHYFEAAAKTVHQILNKAAQDIDNGDLNQALFKIMIEWYQERTPTNISDNTILTYDTEEETISEVLSILG